MNMKYLKYCPNDQPNLLWSTVLAVVKPIKLSCWSPQTLYSNTHLRDREADPRHLIDAEESTGGGHLTRVGVHRVSSLASTKASTARSPTVASPSSRHSYTPLISWMARAEWTQRRGRCGTAGVEGQPLDSTGCSAASASSALKVQMRHGSCCQWLVLLGEIGSSVLV